MKIINYKAILIITFSIILSGHTLPQQSSGDRFEHLTVNEGLSENAVTWIMQDSRGFIWIGTHDGLNKYDGYSFTIYKNNPDDKNSLSDNAIGALCEDRDGMLWIGTIGEGLNRFNPYNETFTRYRHDKDNPGSLGGDVVGQIFEDRRGRLWISDAGIARFNRSNSQFTRLHSTPGILFEDKSGIVWLTVWPGKLYFFDETTETFKYYPLPDPLEGDKDESRKIHYLGRSDILVIRVGNKIYKFSLEEKKIINEREPLLIPPEIKIGFVSHVIASKSEKMLIATNNTGLLEINPKNNQVRHRIHIPNDPDSLSNNIIYGLFEDRSGIIWISTEGGGVNLIKKDKIKFPHYKKNQGTDNCISGNYITSMYKDIKGELWVGTKGSGLNRINEEKGGYTVYKHNAKRPFTSLSDDYITSINSCEDPGYLWIGTANGLNKFNITKGTFYHYKNDKSKPGSLSDNNIQNTFRDSKGNLWIIAYVVLDRLPAGKSEFIHYKHDPNVPESISAGVGYPIFEDRSGIIWLGSWTGGLNRYDSNRDCFYHYVHDQNNPTSLSHNRVWAIFEDSKGRMWIGTYGGGLNLFDRETGKFKRYFESHGLANNVIYGILEDDKGHLWMSTNNGLSRFNPETESFRNYDMADGLQSKEFNTRAFLKDFSGKMYFGGINGYNAFYPDNIKDNLHIPPVVINSITVSGQRMLPGKPFHTIEEIKLRHNQNFLSFEFAALDYYCPVKNRYRYIMEGSEKKWNFVDAGRRFADYRDVSPGKYTFHVKGSNNDGIWNEIGMSVKISILPPFWSTWWFKTLGLISFGFLFYFMITFLKKHLNLIRFWKTKNIIGNYRITETIGSGGMGIIYKGVNLHNSSKTVALKVLKDEQALSENQRRRFINEGAIIDSLDHPNIVRIYERANQESNLFIAMEYLEGITLQHKIKTTGILPSTETNEIFAQMADVISVLHDKGIVHRDLKPENIMLINHKGTNNFVKILDFGVAKMENVTRLTKSGMFVGTMGFTPPEQVSGSEVGYPGDIYALGIILYEMVTAERPFFGETSLEIMKQVLNEDPLDPQTFNSDLSKGLNNLIIKMLSKDPRDRPTAPQLRNIIKDIF